jgi:hypothetical protein
MYLTILPVPDVNDPTEAASWLRKVGAGVAEMVQVASWDHWEDDDLRSACAWLTTDLGSICEATAEFIETGTLKFSEAPIDSPARLREMDRLVSLKNGPLGVSDERKYVTDAIRSRLDRERRRRSLH